MKRRVLLGALLVAGTAAAEPVAAPALVPPRLLVEVTPPYPPGAEGEARVVLEVTVGDDGAPAAVRVVDGVAPFREAAVRAVEADWFEPARRGDIAVAARITLVVAFSPPPPPAPELGPAVVGASAASPPAPAPAPDEVTISGQRRVVASPGEQRIGRADVRVLPGAFGDPYRAIEMLPGVVPTISGLPYYYIRGAPPSAVGYYVDDVRVPYLFHFALGPGVVQPVLIDEVSLHPDAFPGRFGRYAGAVVAGRTRDPASEREGEAVIRVFDAGAYVEAPFADGKGSAGIGGRYSYTAGVFSLFAKDTTIDYRDYNARVSYQLGDRWRATAFAFGSYDFASQLDGEPKVDKVLFASEFHRLDLRLDRTGADGSTSRIGVALGVDRTRIEGQRFAQDFLVDLRARHRMPISRALDVEMGLNATLDHYAGDLPSIYAVSKDEYDNARALFAPRDDTATGAWVSSSYHPLPGFDLTGTLRADVFTSAGEVRIGPSPRFSVRAPLRGDALVFVGALGIGSQPPAFAIPVPAVGYRGLPGGLGYGYQKSAGLESRLPWKLTARAVGFHNTYDGLRDLTRSSGSVDLTVPQSASSSPGQAIGLELSVNRKLSERLGGFVSYTLSRSALGSTLVEAPRVSPFDRTHVFQTGASLDLGRGYRVGARFLAYRGWPTQRVNLEAAAISTTSARLPTFARVDARVEKRWDFRRRGHIALVLEVLNATGAKEITSEDCDATGCHPNAIGPVTVPSIGVEGAL